MKPTAALAALLLVAACSSSSSSGPTTTAPTTSPSKPAVEITPLEGRPSALVVHDTTLWVADDERGVVLRLDATTGRQLGDPIAVTPHPIAIDADATSVWVADRGGDLTRIDATSAVADPPISLGGQLTDVLLVAGTVWVADIETSTVHLLDEATGALIGDLLPPAGVVRLAATPTTVWLSNFDHTISSIGIADHALGAPIAVGNGPIGLAVDEQQVWVANSDDGTIDRVPLTAGSPRGGAIKVGSGPVGVTIAGDFVWVVNHDAHTATRLARADGRVVDQAIALGMTPRGSSVGPAGVWVAGVDPSAVVLIKSS